MIDWSRVNELVDEIGPEDFQEVLELFLMEVDAAIVQLEEAAGDPQGVEAQMHFLKGSALNLGFEAMAQLCLQGEKAAAGGDADTVTAAQVRDTYEASRDMFQSDLSNKTAA